MFSKANSKFLTLTNVFLLGQIVVGVVYFLIAMSQFLFPAGAYQAASSEWVRTLPIIVIAGILLWIVNKKQARLFGAEMTRAEKIFKTIALLVFDIALCVAIAYILTMPLNQTSLSIESEMQSFSSAMAVASVFLIMLLVVPRLWIFRQQFSKSLNYVLLVVLIALGSDLAQLIGILVGGPDGTSEIIQAVYAQQIFRFVVTAVFLVALTFVLVLNGDRLSGNTKKDKTKSVQEAATAKIDRETPGDQPNDKKSQPEDTKALSKDEKALPDDEKSQPEDDTEHSEKKAGNSGSEPENSSEPADHEYGQDPESQKIHNLRAKIKELEKENAELKEKLAKSE